MLKNIPASDKFNELEFYIPLGSITVKGLSNIFFKSGIKSNQEFAGAMRNLGFKPHRGFIKGFIDMVFMYKGKYYIVDWKSNYLGNNISYYSVDKLKESMKDNYYILQYYIYSAALHRYLSFRKEGYDYEKHFGGIFYFFIRGIDPEYPSCGIFHDVPQVEELKSFSSFLSHIPEEAAS
jgi:exodeoxyribonuclease V beta subunit